MEKIELSKYWYYRLKDNYSKENFEKNKKFDWQKNELEIFLIDNLFDVRNELEIKDKVLLRLRASSYYGQDFVDYIKDLKTGVFKLIWNKEPGGLTWDEYFVKNPTDDKEIDYAAHKRTHPYDSNYFYSIVESVGSEIKEDKIDEITFNNERRSIHLVENKNLEVVDIKISAEVFANSYTFYYESKGTGTIRTDENQEILDDLERLLKKIEPSLKKEFEKFLLSIGIDFKNEFPFKDMPKLSEDKPCLKESKNTGGRMYNESGANKENISNTNNEHTYMNKKDTNELLNRLINSDYNPTSNEIAWMKEQTFKTYRSQWLKFKEMKEPFPSIFKELKTNGSILLLEFYKLLNSPSDHFRNALLNSFLHEINRNSKSVLFTLAQGMKAKVLLRRPDGQKEEELHICLIKKK